MLDFTVLIPVFNTKPAHLQECMQSVLKQTLTAPQILIVDDGSTNLDTVRALEEYARNPIVKVHTLDQNRGVSHAMNVGHGLINTEYVALMGSDDISIPTRFERQATFLSKRPTIDVLGTQIIAFYDHDVKRKPIYKSKHTPRPIAGKGWQTNHGTVMYKNQAVKDVGGYNVDMRRAQDIDMFNRMMAAGKKFMNIYEHLYLWRRYLRA